MLKLFSASQLFALLLMPAVALAALLPTALAGGMVIRPSQFPWQGMAEGLQNHPWSQFLLAVLVVLGGSMIANQVFNRHEFHVNATRIPGFVFLITSCTIYLSFHEILPLMANIPVLFGISRISGVYRQPHAVREYFESGFWFGLSALIFPPYMALILALYIAIGYTRAFNWREYLLPAIGFALPLAYWAAWLFWNHRLDSFILFHSMLGQHFSLGKELSGWMNNTLLLSIAGSLLLSMPRFVLGFERPNNKARNVKWVFFIVSTGLLSSLVMEALFAQAVSYSVLVIPVAFISGYWYVNYRYSLIAPFVFYAWLTVSVLSMFHSGYTNRFSSHPPTAHLTFAKNV